MLRPPHSYSCEPSANFFKKRKKAGRKIPAAAKSELLLKLEAKSVKEIERVLISHASTPVHIIKESIRTVSESVLELKIPIDQELHLELLRLKEIWSHEMPDASFLDVIRKMTKRTLKQVDPIEKAKRHKIRQAHDGIAKVGTQSSRVWMSQSVGSEMIETKSQRKATPLAESSRPHTSRTPLAEIKHDVMLRDEGVCTYKDKSGRQCGSKHRLQFDHIVPFAIGGKTSADNLRLRCIAHNQRHAIETYGSNKMKNYL